MTFPRVDSLKTGRRLTVMLALFIALILGGNGLIIFQFGRIRVQTGRLTVVSQQLIAVLRLQEVLQSFHQRLNEVAQSRDGSRFAREVQPLRAGLLDQAQPTRHAMSYLPAEFRVDPAFLTALDTIEVTLPSQLRDITALARAGDWDMVRLRLDNELNRIETTTAALVKSIDRDLDQELPRVVAAMRDVQNRILVIVPVTAIATILTAAFFGWAIARRILELRVEERVSERTRIARDLHDTLLQSFQGVLLKFTAVTYALPERPDQARRALEAAIEEARAAIAEGRDAVQGLRASAAITDDLPRAITALGEGLSAIEKDGRAADFRVHVEGEPQRLAPAPRDEVYRIAAEALRNAFRHAAATRIEVDIQYDKRHLRLRVRDDGKGIDPNVLGGGGRAGHHGLPGMQERARIVGGELAIWSELDSGTEIEVRIPAALAYARSAGGQSMSADDGTR
jgi:signal transduction histidine kinase